MERTVSKCKKDDDAVKALTRKGFSYDISLDAVQEARKNGACAVDDTTQWRDNHITSITVEYDSGVFTITAESGTLNDDGSLA